MTKRTQAQVDALWPANMDQYTFRVHVATECTPVRNKWAHAPSCVTLAKRLQPLFWGSQAMAGRFLVLAFETLEGREKAVFVVRFYRDVTDDSDVVNDELLAGADFITTLTEQFKSELRAAIEDTGSTLTIESIEAPKFSKIRLHHAKAAAVQPDEGTPVKQLYTIPFLPRDWEEIEVLSFDGFRPEPDVPMTRAHWLALARLALGKAVLMRRGEYRQHMSEDDPADDEVWADQLTGIAGAILKEFRPGDGKL